MSRSISAGESIKLRARFKDDLGQIVQADEAYLHIYEPDEDTSDIDNAILVSGIPLYIGNGIFEYEYTVPSDAVTGVWQDVWYGVLPNQTVSGIFAFSVVNGGIAESIENQLYPNNIVSVTLTSDILALDGTSLSENYAFEFLTTTIPSYTNIRKIRLEAGGFLGGIEDDAIQTAILEASIEADVLTFATSITNNNLYQHARREYTTCLASFLLVQNTGNQLLKSKTLADLSVSYDTTGVNKMLDKLRSCVERWEPQLLAAGGAKSMAQPAYVVKGELDPDRPMVSRMWSPTDGISGRIPAANTRELPLGTRRSLRHFRPKWW